MWCAAHACDFYYDWGETDMGDKGGKKDKEKNKQQQLKKHQQQEQRKEQKVEPVAR
jgi:hypothetical protein